MRADGGTHGAANDRDVGATLLLADGSFEPVTVLFGIGSHDGDGHGAIGHVVLAERLEDGLERLLAAAVDADQRQRAGQVVGELGLDIELCRELRRRGRNAAAGSQCVEALERKVAVDVGLCLVCPIDQLLGGQSRRTLTHGLERQERAGRAGQSVVDHVELKIGILGAHGVRRLARGVVARRQRRGKAQVDRGRALFGALGKELDIATERHSRGGHAGTGAHAVVELLGCDARPDVIRALLAIDNEGETQDIDIEVRGDLGAKVAAGIDDDAATVRMTGGCGLVHQSDSLRKKAATRMGWPPTVNSCKLTYFTRQVFRCGA